MQEEDQSYDGRPWTAGLQSQLNGMHDWDNNRVQRVKEKEEKAEAARLYSAKVAALERAYNSYSHYMHTTKPHVGEISTQDAQKLFRDVGLVDFVSAADVRGAISTALAFTSKGKESGSNDILVVTLFPAFARPTPCPAMMDPREFRKTLLALGTGELRYAATMLLCDVQYWCYAMFVLTERTELCDVRYCLGVGAR
eukprot:57689-Rhodomonas_salina.4